MEDNGGMEPGKQQQRNRYLLHIVLFLVTLLTTSIAGLELITGRSFFRGGSLTWADLPDGLPFSLSFLGFLTVHEFGHYFTAVYHRVKVSLPYYIPIYIPFSLINIGSFGAVIRIRELPGSRQKYFDIGVAGPLAGFVVALGLLVYGLLNLPPMEETVLGIHPEYLLEHGGVPTLEDLQEKGKPALVLGGSLLMDLLMAILPLDRAELPPAFEMMHYPYIFTGFLTLFFTALNLLPIGQLDGGHVVYGLFGKRIAGYVSRASVLALLLVGGTGVVTITEFDPSYYSSYQRWLGEEALKLLLYAGFVFYVVRRLVRDWSVGQILLGVGGALLVQAAAKWLFPGIAVNGIWLLYSFLAVTMIGVDHPRAPDDTPLDRKRKVLAWLAILIFVLCFSPSPLVLL
ncbi:MAG: site-2 protease family protein [Bacteroidota bacterium]